MTTLTIILIAIIALLAAGCIIFLNDSKKANRTIERLYFDLETANEELNNAKIDLGVMSAKLTAMEEQKELIQQEQERRDKTLTEQFKGLAADILKEQTEQMNKSSKESLDLMLKPFQENIKAFKERVESIYSEENTQRGALKNELKNLMELNQKITTETSNLTSALRGNSKVQGDWGEMILERILEDSNLIKGVHYTTQENLKGEEGNNLRPDVILNLPDEKRIVIDSKTSLTAFVNHINCEGEAERKSHLIAHIASVKMHIKELSSKEYQKLLNGPDFVIMFIPNEPAFLSAMHADNGLWAEAYDNKVIISSPTNLFAMLKMVSDLWERDAQDRNTSEIVTRGTKIYEQLVNFVSSLEGIDTALSNAKKSYDDAYKRLCTGNDNIIRNGEKLRNLGLPTKKSQSQKALDQDSHTKDDN